MSKDKLDSIKLKIFRNKKLATMIYKKQYLISDINNLVNKIDIKHTSNNEAINVYNDIAKKVKKIHDQDKHRIGKFFWILLIL